MRALSSAEVVALAGTGEALDADERALLVLATARPAATVDELRATGIGARDAELLAMRRATFGETLECVATCPSCAEALEYELDVTTLLAGSGAASEPFEQEVAGVRYRLRPPTADDVRRIASAAEVNRGSETVTGVAAAVTALVHACVIGPPLADAHVDGIREAFEQWLVEVEPLVDSRFTLTCPACGSSFDQHLDTAAYLWSEIQEAASGLLRDVHALAAAYHWSERDILALPAARRRFYIECVGV
jgi:hypothetical protein